MAEINIIIQNYTVYCYDGIRRISIFGENKFKFRETDTKARAHIFLAQLCNECNLKSEKSLKLDVLSDDTGIFFSHILAEETDFTECNKNDVFKAVLKDLANNSSLETTRYGINFGDRCYFSENGKIKEFDFNISAYTICADELVKYIKK